MNTSPLGWRPDLLPAASRKPCRFNGCKRVALVSDNPLDVHVYCPWHYAQLVSKAYMPKNEAVAMDAYVKRQYGR